MSSRLKMIIIAAGAVAVILISIIVIGKYTTLGMPYRIGRLNKQIERRYSQLQKTHDLHQSRQILAIELNKNRLIKTAELRGELFSLCYANDACVDFEIGW